MFELFHFQNIQLDVDLNDDTSKGRYRSPLDHMQNNLNIETEQRFVCRINGTST